MSNSAHVLGSRKFHRPFVYACFLVFAFLGVMAILAPRAHGQAVRDDDGNVTLEGTLTDVQFAAGKTVLIKATVSDDVFAAGREVTLDGATLVNAIMAGYEIEQRSGTVADMIVTGNSILVGGTVTDDLVAAGRTIRVASGATVGGDARLAGERVEIEGGITGNVRAAGRRVTINGAVGGKVDLIAKRIVIGPNAVIGGDLVYRSGEKPEIAEGATIEGTVRELESRIPELKSFVRTLIGIGIGLMVSWAIAGLVTVAILVLVFPALFTSAATRLRAHPWSHLGRGIVILLAGAILMGLFFVSIVGIPLGGTLFVTIALLKLFGVVTVSACIGLYLRGRIRSTAGDAGMAGRIGWTVIGAVIIALVMMIPFVGVIVAGLAIAAGVGAGVAELWSRLRAAA